MRNIIVNNIKKCLERKVKGLVIVRDNGKTLYIRIVYSSFEFKTKVENLTTLILNGYSSYDIGYDILQEYKNFLNSLLFK